MSVAVWIHNYGNEKYIRDCIESVLRQSYQDFTCYVFDNHSKDGAPAIIAEYAQRDPRVLPIAMPDGLAGIPAMNYAWNYLNGADFDYSICLGGHDFFASEHHLETLVNRAEAEKRAGREFALIYNDVFQINMENQICGKFQDIHQLAGQTPAAILPQVLISTVDSPQFYGFWNESIRKQVPIRHQCAGFDHLVVMHAGILGAVLFEHRTAIVMRAPPPGDGLHMYAKRHFGENKGPSDFYQQLEWVIYCIMQTTAHMPEPQREVFRRLLVSSAFTQYVCLRGYNLNIFEGAMAAFNADPLVQAAIGGASATADAVAALIEPYAA